MRQGRGRLFLMSFAMTPPVDGVERAEELVSKRTMKIRVGYGWRATVAILSTTLGAVVPRVDHPRVGVSRSIADCAAHVAYQPLTTFAERALHSSLGQLTSSAISQSQGQ